MTPAVSPSLTHPPLAGAGERDHHLPSLMRDYCAGDVRAFELLYAACAPVVRAHLSQRCAAAITGDDAAAAQCGRDAQSVAARLDELLDETFLELHGARQSYVRGADPRGWLLEIADAVAVRDLRRREPSWFRRGMMKLGGRGRLQPFSAAGTRT